MRIVGRDLLDKFAIQHPMVRGWVKNWLADVQGRTWSSSHDVKQSYPTASFLGEKFAIFNVKGNDYRMAVQIAYQSQVVLIKWIGTHEQYSRINWELKQHEIRRS